MDRSVSERLAACALPDHDGVERFVGHNGVDRLTLPWIGTPRMSTSGRI
jgi:hypothetical protein